MSVIFKKTLFICTFMFISIIAVNIWPRNTVYAANVSTKTTIMGQSTLTKEQMIKYLQANCKKEAAYISSFVTTVINESSIEGVKADVTFALIMKETNYLKFNINAKEYSNNFGNFSTTNDPKKLASFSDMKTGIRAVVQHLKAYASKEKLKQTAVDPRFKYVTRGSAQYIEWLGVNNNPQKIGWSIKVNYGYDIIKIIQDIKTSKPVVTNSPTSVSSKLSKTIILDAGHGGLDPGAIAYGYYEKYLNMKLTEKIAEKLRAIGANVLFTRKLSTDNYLSLEERARLANSMKGDLFISLHHDFSLNNSISGTSVHFSSFKPLIETKDAYVVYQGGKYKYLRESSKGIYISYKGKEKLVSKNEVTVYDSSSSEAAKKSEKLANSIVNAISSLGIKNRGIQDHNLYVTKNTNIPSILIEAGFMSNKVEIAKLANPAYQDQIAQNIVNAIVKYYKN